MEWVVLITAILNVLPALIAYLQQRQSERKATHETSTKRSLHELDAGVGGMQPLPKEGLPPL